MVWLPKYHAKLHGGTFVKQQDLAYAQGRQGTFTAVAIMQINRVSLREPKTGADNRSHEVDLRLMSKGPAGATPRARKRRLLS